ncbi:MAG: cohesin domain-containing protein, partial [candidate division Zixibacteria bacterium]|nr:cohesin domain-containing protein [candidate division Zixibacteria bacterium]
VQISVEYDPAQFEPLDPVLTERSQNLSLFYSYKNNLLKIGLVDLKGQNNINAGSGSIVTLRFKPKVANFDLSRLKISEADLVDREANTLQTIIK